MLAELPHVEEGRVEALELLLGDDSGPYIREKEAYVLSASKSLIMSQLACPVDDVEEHLGVVLQPHGEVVELLCLPHEGAPHVDPLVDGDARLLLGLGLVCRKSGKRSSSAHIVQVQSSVACKQIVKELIRFSPLNGSMVERMIV